jgi:hypothetical protein
MKHEPTMPRPPQAWLVVRHYGPKSTFAYEKVIAASTDRPKLQRVAKYENEDLPGCARIVLDHPSLKVCHYGLDIREPCWLTARDIWFERYADILENRLADPRVAQVFTFEPGTLPDPLTSHKSSASGPFTFPRGAAWPKCGFCRSRLAFFGTLDFRQYADVRVPGAALVLHVCAECGVCADRETWSLTWIKEGEPVEQLGDRDKEVLVGTRWCATEYPILALDPKDLATEGPFLEENGLYANFSCFADKIGGHVFRIQDSYTPADSRGSPMVYIGQFLRSPDVDIGDSGIAYLYYSEATKETIMYPESF